MSEPLIAREEVTAALLALLDIQEDVARIVDILGEEPDAEEEADA